MQPWALYFKSLLLWLLPWPGRGQFQVKTPKSSVIVQLGKAAVLPCHLSPSTDAQNMEIRWYRDDQSVLLHEYRNSQDHMDQQSLEYQGRTELLRENINQGQVALRIHPILARDEGQYSCVFVSSTQVGQAQFELLVAASGAPPHIHIQPADTEGITLTCSSSGWYPDPELQWRDPQGQPLSPDSETRSEQEDGLIYVESSVTMTSSSRAPLCCWIGNPVLREEKEERLSVAEALFPRVSNKRVEWTVMLVLPVLTIIIAAVILLRSRRCREGVNLFGRHGQKEAKRFAGRLTKEPEDVIVDEDTAHPQLTLSECEKHVEYL